MKLRALSSDLVLTGMNTTSTLREGIDRVTGYRLPGSGGLESIRVLMTWIMRQAGPMYGTGNEHLMHIQQSGLSLELARIYLRAWLTHRFAHHPEWGCSCFA